MISTIGNFSLSAAVLVAAGAVLASVAGIRFRSPAWMRASRWGVAGVMLLLSVATAALLTALLKSDFRFEYVVDYTERALPWGYKLAAFWAGQAGSLLLWAWLLAVLCVLAVIGLRKLNGTEGAVAVAVLALVSGFFAVLLLFTANPFELAAGPVASDGHGLNPMLQDPGMIIHPPLLFLGYAGFTVPFAVVIGVLVAGRSDNHWIALIRRWLLASWIFLTAGIVLGAWWAYIELGWGGYWAWDPVENASLLPWLTATALLHTIMVQQHRGMFKIWNASLIALTFILCIFGTYLTRSGVIDSVHAFPESLIGRFFLVFLLLCLGGSAALILWRIKALRGEHRLEGLISREGAFLLGNILLLIMMLTTLVGTIYPLLSAPFGESVTVKASFYNKVVAPMGILLAALMALGPVLAFGRSAASKIARSMIIPAIAALLVILIVWVSGTRNLWALLSAGIAALGTFAVIVSLLRSVSARHASTGENFLTAAVRLIDRDHRRYGGQLAHLGVMMIVLGVVGSSLFATKDTFQLRPGESADLDGRTLTFVKLDFVREVNYEAARATVTMTDADGSVTTLQPEKRLYDKWQREFNTEIAVRSTPREDIYLILAGWEKSGEVAAIQALVNPLVLWIWLGGIVLCTGGLFSMLPRLLPRPAPAAVTQPARAGRPGRKPSLPEMPIEPETVA